MDYIPKPVEQKEAPPSYELKKDVSGKAPIKRGAQVLQDFKGRKFRVPFPPKENCKRCLGRGYVGINAKTNYLIICKRCYPMM